MKKMTKRNFTEKFRNEMIDRNKMNYLVGGDGDGSQGSTDPWPKK
jgi:hypothetical protein